MTGQIIPYNLSIRGFFKPITRKPSTEWLPVLNRNETRRVRCRLSLRSDCGVTTSIRNRNRRSIRAVGGSELGHRRFRKPEAGASPSTHHRHHRLTPPRQVSPAADIMPVCSVLEKCNDAVLGAELTCSLREENKAQRESYSAEWQCVSLKTQPQDR